MKSSNRMIDSPSRDGFGRRGSSFRGISHLSEATCAETTMCSSWLEVRKVMSSEALAPEGNGIEIC